MVYCLVIQMCGHFISFDGGSKEIACMKLESADNLQWKYAGYL